MPPAHITSHAANIVDVVICPEQMDAFKLSLSQEDRPPLDVVIQSSPVRPPRDFTSDDVASITTWLYACNDNIRSLSYCLEADLMDIFEDNSPAFSAHEVFFDSGKMLRTLQPFQTLTALALRTGYSVPLSFLVQLIASCPALEDLTIEKLLSSKPRESAGDLEIYSSFPVHIPTLSNLTLSNYGYGYATRLFETIAFPATAQVCLTFEGRGRPSFRASGTSLQPVLDCITHATIQYAIVSEASDGEGPTLRMTVASRDLQFSLHWQFQVGLAEPPSEWLGFENLGTDVFRLNGLRELDVELQQIAFHITHWQELLYPKQELRHLKVLFFGCQPTSTKYLYQAFCEYESRNDFELSVLEMTSSTI
ncbi:hypothetical protein CERSUDRAFT_92789 [Gelatoporia subvermispora B]|uniref:F-box domain-containing protein n=1 Tax=Ceriporiopsis subvermispora (strain B) TaxID=914234 RepID=M2RJV6_CERS8|nr:hypothetical protein CERSUDRAFT_92789 [Gelatoporia subvermispora B]